jgi:hypothetical protein
MQNDSNEAVVAAMKAFAASRARIPESAVNDDTPVSDPCELTMLLTIKFNKVFVCRDIAEASTFGGAKENIFAPSR